MARGKTGTTLGTEKRMQQCKSKRKGTSKMIRSIPRVIGSIFSSHAAHMTLTRNRNNQYLPPLQSYHRTPSYPKSDDQIRGGSRNT